ncbi:hypothetical protein NDI39_31515 [Microcoleus sp. ZQ-A2]|nr:hypothetical protein [Microcoleus sp. FACHB-1]
MCYKPTPLNFCITLRAALVPSLSLAIASQLLVISISPSISKATEGNASDTRSTTIKTQSSPQSSYFPRRTELRRCFITSPDTCIFRGYDSILSTADLDQSIDYRKADFLAEIAAKYAAAKTYNRALLVARSISIPRPKVTALTAVAAEYASSGQKDAAKQLLKEAIQSVQTADRFGKVYARSQIAVQYAAIGQSETASQIFKLAVQDASNETDLIRKPELLSQVAVGLLTAYP